MSNPSNDEIRKAVASVKAAGQLRFEDVNILSVAATELLRLREENEKLYREGQSFKDDRDFIFGALKKSREYVEALTKERDTLKAKLDDAYAHIKKHCPETLVERNPKPKGGDDK
jgi:hypothetical protein